MEKTVQVYDRVFPRFSRVEIHPRISQILAKFPRGDLLDLPAGSGALSYRLWKDGFSVTACDLHPENFEPSEIPVVRGDFSSRLPFEDATFDYAAFVEGPEHAEYPLQAFRELARVVKPNGCLIVTIPNYCNIEARLRYLMHGSCEKPISQAVFREDFRGNTSMLHISPLGYVQLKFFLETAGFEIEWVGRDRFKWKQLFLYPLVLLLQLGTFLYGRRGREKYWLHEINANPVLLGGNTLMLIARRNAGEEMSSSSESQVLDSKQVA